MLVLLVLLISLFAIKCATEPLNFASEDISVVCERNWRVWSQRICPVIVGPCEFEEENLLQLRGRRICCRLELRTNCRAL